MVASGFGGDIAETLRSALRQRWSVYIHDCEMLLPWYANPTNKGTTRAVATTRVWIGSEQQSTSGAHQTSASSRQAAWSNLQGSMKNSDMAYLHVLADSRRSASRKSAIINSMDMIDPKRSR